MVSLYSSAQSFIAKNHDDACAQQKRQGTRPAFHQ
jgi:hypothetical protein